MDTRTDTPPAPAAALVVPIGTADASLERVGGKAAGLARLLLAGLPVPDGFVLTTDAYRRYVAANHLQAAITALAGEVHPDQPASLERAATRIGERFATGTLPDDVAAAVKRAYAGLGQDVAVAVRSSATAEDLPGLSFAGQQESYLNVRGEAALLEAIRRCWASLWSARAIAYRARQHISPADVSLAVVVQRLVPAEAAGVLFTAHPVTGNRDQALINAAWGLGEAVVGGTVTPDSITVDKASGQILTQTIADKGVMTVLTPEGTATDSVPIERRRAPSLDSGSIAQLVRLGARIEQLFGQPVDVEWAEHAGRLFMLQARPITALPEPAPGPSAPPPSDWPLPNRRASYFRASVVELLPDPLSPLFATLALPEWNAALEEVGRALGMAGFARDYALVTINGYAYYQMLITPIRTARLLAGLPRFIPRAARLLTTAFDRWDRQARPAYTAAARAWEARDLTAASATELVAGCRQIATAAARHYLVIQSGILPAAYMAESLFRTAYDRLIRRPGDPPALTFLLGYDSAPIQAETALYALATWAREQTPLAAYLARTPGQQIAAALAASAPAGSTSAGSAPAGSAPADLPPAIWDDFARRVADYLARFGYAIYDLDFARPLPADDPAPVFETLRFFLSGQAADPAQRQAAAADQRERATAALLRRLRGVRRRLFLRLLRPAQRFAPLREDALAEVGRGWPVLRRMCRELGRRLVAVGALRQPDDVFWLTDGELAAAATAVDAGRPAAALAAVVDERRATWTWYRRVTPPVQLPLRGASLLGMDLSRWLPARSRQGSGNTISGTGTSPGRVTGTARVLRGPEDFTQLRPGDILVAKITTPAWTPLFALASAVVTDVGGPLSHGSIVAREYHIPAVLGTGVATERIRSGQRLTVDGDAGMVQLHD